MYIVNVVSQRFKVTCVYDSVCEICSWCNWSRL